MDFKTIQTHTHTHTHTHTMKNTIPEIFSDILGQGLGGLKVYPPGDGQRNDCVIKSPGTIFCVVHSPHKIQLTLFVSFAFDFY